MIRILKFWPAVATAAKSWFPNSCNSYSILNVLLLASLVTAPTTVQAARTTEEQQREHCLNNPCPGDKQPQYNGKTEQPFKRGGRWFIGPRVYFSLDKGAFYWPSKHPAYAGGEYPEKGKKFSDIAIEFFIEAKEQTGEMYELINKAANAGSIVAREQLRPGLERIKIKRESPIEPVETYYVATTLRTPVGAPPTLHCREVHARSACTTGFSWKPSYRIYVRFRQHHGKDWPEIYSEIIRILNLVEEK